MRRSPATPSRRQADVLDAIRAYTATHGYPPSMRDLGKALWITVSTVWAAIAALERKGWLRRAPRTPRAVTLVGRKRREPR